MVWQIMSLHKTISFRISNQWQAATHLHIHVEGSAIHVDGALLHAHTLLRKVDGFVNPVRRRDPQSLERLVCIKENTWRRMTLSGYDFAPHRNDAEEHTPNLQDGGKRRKMC